MLDLLQVAFGKNLLFFNVGVFHEHTYSIPDLHEYSRYRRSCSLFILSFTDGQFP